MITSLFLRLPGYSRSFLGLAALFAAGLPPLSAAGDDRFPVVYDAPAFRSADVPLSVSFEFPAAGVAWDASASLFAYYGNHFSFRRADSTVELVHLSDDGDRLVANLVSTYKATGPETVDLVFSLQIGEDDRIMVAISSENPVCSVEAVPNSLSFVTLTLYAESPELVDIQLGVTSEIPLQERVTVNPSSESAGLEEDQNPRASFRPSTEGTDHALAQRIAARAESLSGRAVADRVVSRLSSRLAAGLRPVFVDRFAGDDRADGLEPTRTAGLVGGPKATIREGVLAARSGDRVVVVFAGHYPENSLPHPGEGTIEIVPVGDVIVGTGNLPPPPVFEPKQPISTETNP